VDTLKVPGHTRLYPDRLELDSLGAPVIVAASAGGIGRDTHVLSWADSTWLLRASLGYGTAFSHQVVSTTTGFPMIWQTLDDMDDPAWPYMGTYLVMTEPSAGDFEIAPDTVAVVANHNFSYTGAASPRRRWAAKSDASNGLRVWFSDTAHVWHEADVPGSGDNGVTLAPLDDSTAIVAWAGFREPVRWGKLRGTEWIDGGAVADVPLHLATTPRLRLSPSGSAWLTWGAEDNYVQLAEYRDGAWSMAESLHCAQTIPGQYISKVVRGSRDTWERPTVAWTEHNVDRGFVGTLCLCVPTDSGYPMGEPVIDTMDVTYHDVVRDRNGDVWLAWQTWSDGLFWTHTHVSATSGAPRFDGSGQRPMVRWSLSGSAPGSFWAVLRAVGSGDFEAVARVQAGSGPEVAWLDSSAPVGEVLRYRIRRESVDRRFEQFSDEAAWWPRGSSLGLTSVGAQPTAGEIELLVVGAEAGELYFRAFDLQGREVARQARTAAGSGQDRIRFTLSKDGHPLSPAVYFVRVSDRTGRRSPSIKVVVLR
jgi:hypothetical protein